MFWSLGISLYLELFCFLSLVLLLYLSKFRYRQKLPFCLWCFVARNKEININFAGTRGVLHAFGNFFVRGTVNVSLAFAVWLTQAAMKFPQEQVSI